MQARWSLPSRITRLMKKACGEKGDIVYQRRVLVNKGVPVKLYGQKQAEPLL